MTIEKHNLIDTSLEARSPQLGSRLAESRCESNARAAAERGEMTDFRFDDPDQYVNGTPYEAFAALRNEAPFSWRAASDRLKDGFWLATKYRDIVSISRNSKLFATNAPLLSDPVPVELWPVFPALGMIADNLMTFDAQKHVVFRSLANSLFSGARIAQLEDKIRATCIEIRDRVSNRPRFDFAEEAALAIPVEVVMGTFMGIPRADLATLTRYVLTINAMDDPELRPHQDALFEAAEELFAYGMALLKRVQRVPSGDLLGDLLHAGSLKGLSAETLIQAYWFPLAAGAFDTTASTIAGGVQALLQFPEELNNIREDPSLIPLAIDEMLRWVSPTVYFRRTATMETDFNGYRIKKGDKIVLCYASANRDEDVFPHPETFDVKRTPNPHVAFGYGTHFCLGSRLATLILRIFLEEFLPLISRMQISGKVIRTRSGWMNRIKSMPVTLLPVAMAPGD